jgi:predicted nucleic acid-binding protein
MKTLVDTSAWLEYFKGTVDVLDQLLSENNVLTHSIVIGELSCGSLKNRHRTLGDLKLLPKIKEASFDEAIELIESHRLYGKGLGFSDIQLLASALIANSSLFSLDKAINHAAKELGVQGY